MKFKCLIGAVVLLSVSTVNASLVSVSATPLSTLGAGTAASIIAAPLNVNDAGISNTAQQGFDERQNVLLNEAATRQVNSLFM